MWDYWRCSLPVPNSPPFPDTLLHVLTHFIFCVSILKFGCIGLGVFYWLVTLPLVREVRAFGAVVRQIRFSVFFALAAPAALYYNQGGEAIRVITKGISSENPLQNFGYTFAFLLGCFVIAYFSWRYARITLRAIPCPDSSACQLEETPANAYLPRYCFYASLLVSAGAILYAAFPAPPFRFGLHESLSAQSAGLSPGWPYLLLLCSFLVGMVMVLKFNRKRFLQWRLARFLRTTSNPEHVGLETSLILSAGSAVTMMAAYRPLVIAQIGPAAVFLMGCTFLLALSTLANLYSRKWHLPILPALITAALLCSLFGLGDNHSVRTLAASSTISDTVSDTAADQNAGAAQPTASPPERRDLNDAFTDWLNRRRLEEKYDPDKPYPVFFIATEGGGIRAAYQTAMLLASLQQENRAFAKHTFMISGVSGGSVGATVFAGLMALPEQNAPTFVVDATDNILKRDFLSAPLTRLLTTDLVQRLLPYPCPHTDRGEALELAFEETWMEGLKETGLTHPALRMTASLSEVYKDFTQPTSAIPALFLNTTCVETGQRMVISNLVPRAYNQERQPDAQNKDWDEDGVFNSLPGVDGLHPYAGIAEGKELRLSTAAFLSARFPLFSPSGSIEQKRVLVDTNASPALQQTPLRVTRHYVDGAYYENSGVTTLNDILTALGGYVDEATWSRTAVHPLPAGQPQSTLKACEHRGKWYPVILIIGFDDAVSTSPVTISPADPRFEQTPLRAPLEEFSPLLAALNLREGHARSAQQHLESNLKLLSAAHSGFYSKAHSGFYSKAHSESNDEIHNKAHSSEASPGSNFAYSARVVRPDTLNKSLYESENYLRFRFRQYPNTTPLPF